MDSGMWWSRTGLLAATLLVAVSGVQAEDTARVLAAKGYQQPGKVVRFASFNASLNRFNAGDLISDLTTPDDAQARAVAEIIQRTAPDVLLINEFDYDQAGEAARLFQHNYLALSQNGAAPVHYPYVYLAESNTGLPSGFDLNNDGSVGGPNDAFGFGFFRGQFGMVLYSRYPILDRRVRTFQRFLWRDMPAALLPDDPDTPAAGDWYSEEELEVFRLSSKSHWDVPIRIGRSVVHVLASHPTPPVFDDPPNAPQGVDFNGRRNRDEIRFWADYITPLTGGYIVDDQGRRGPLGAFAHFVIMGDQNADPFDGDSTGAPAELLLEHPRVNAGQTPGSKGGVEAAERQGFNNADQRGDPAFDTADFAESNFGGPGNLRVDYVLPSLLLPIVDSGVFWPPSDDELSRLTGEFPFPSSDHRLVWVDVRVPARGIFGGR